MKDIRIKIGEREVPLVFTMREFAAIEEEIGYLGDVKELILKGKNRIRNIVSAIRIMGNAGLKAAGAEADLDDEWLLDHMDPHGLIGYQAAILAAMSRDSASEAAEERHENEDRDLTLEEINEKKDGVNIPSAG